MNKYIFLKKNIIQFAQKIKRASKHTRSACEEASVKLKLFWFFISFLKFWHISFWTLITHHYYLFLVILKLIICVYFIPEFCLIFIDSSSKHLQVLLPSSLPVTMKAQTLSHSNSSFSKTTLNKTQNPHPLFLTPE